MQKDFGTDSITKRRENAVALEDQIYALELVSSLSNESFFPVHS